MLMRWVARVEGDSISRFRAYVLGSDRCGSGAGR